MKKKNFRFWMVFAIAINLSWAASAQTLTLNISSDSLWTDSVTASPNSCRTGGFWSDTYGNTTGFQIGSFKFTHNSGFDIYSYWGGFTTGANGDSRCYCSNCYDANCTGCPNYCTADSLSGSWGWIHNQWGVMAGGGLSSTSPITATKGVPYLIGYWDYFSETGGTRSLEIKLNGDSLFSPQEIYVCNHPWPYYGNIYGDGFARPFHSGDHFDLIIHAVKSDLREDSIVKTLALHNRIELVQDSTWQYVNLTGLFSGDNDSIQSLYFTMKSTDELVIGNTNYGSNTAVYFNLDRVKVTKTGGIASATAKTKALTTQKAIEVTDYFPITSYTGGVVIIYNSKGEKISQFMVKAGEKINLSKLPAGKYRLQHGHKSIPFTKVK